MILSADKSELRAQAKKKILALIKDKQALFERQNKLIEKIQSLDEFKKAKKILTYFSFVDEFDLSSLILNNPQKLWALPRPIGKGIMLCFQVNKLNELQTLKNGLQVPLATNVLVKPEEFDLILVPGLAFDKKGYRLGRGGGYYDRLSTKTKGKTLGVIFYELYLDELKCVEKHDIAVDKVICG